ncbi:hypothetical protein, partial [Salmonella sp. SAL4445]|uniref:hypothetical protein n=1 Tax=Salmonella sp. SAL4445 TaxID=3159900 RepID=UPI00397A28A9
LVASALLTAGATVGDLLSDFQHRALPLSVPVNAGLLALVMLGGSRFASRLAAQHRRETGAGLPVLLVGPAVAARGVLE